MPSSSERQVAPQIAQAGNLATSMVVADVRLAATIRMKAADAT